MVSFSFQRHAGVECGLQVVGAISRKGVKCERVIGMLVVGVVLQRIGSLRREAIEQKWFVIV